MDPNIVRMLILGTLALLTLPVLGAVLPELAERLSKGMELARSGLRPVFRESGRFFTAEGRLDRAQAASQAGGACFLMIPAAVVFGVCCYVVTVTTLVPLFGLQTTGLPLERMEELMGLSIVLLGAVSLVACTDLLGVTYTTHFAETERARFFLLVCMATFLVASVGIGMGIAWYRGEVMTLLDPLAAPAGASISRVVKLLVIALEVLLVIGTGIALTSLDRFFAVVTGGAIAAAGLLLATLVLLLSLLESIASLFLKVVVSVSETLSPAAGAAKAGAHGVGTAITNLVRKPVRRSEPLAQPSATSAGGSTTHVSMSRHREQEARSVAKEA